MTDFCLNITFPFRLLWMHFNHGKNKFRFSIFGFSHRLYRGSEVTVGSEDPLTIFLKAYLLKKGQVEQVLTTTNLKLKPSPFMPRPNRHTLLKFWAHLTLKTRLTFYFIKEFIFFLKLFYKTMKLLLWNMTLGSALVIRPDFKISSVFGPNSILLGHWLVSNTHGKST